MVAKNLWLAGAHSATQARELCRSPEASSARGRAMGAIAARGGVAFLLACACAVAGACARGGGKSAEPASTLAPSATPTSNSAPAPAGTPPKRCTERACVDQTTIVARGGLVSVTAVASGKETTFACAAVGGAAGGAALDPSCDGTTLTVPMVFEVVRVTTRAGTRELRPTYETHHANGPACEGTCRVARVEIE